MNANIAKEVARLYDWPERLWSRRYRAIPVVDDKAAHARIRYQMSHGAKEASSPESESRDKAQSSRAAA